MKLSEDQARYSQLLETAIVQASASCSPSGPGMRANNLIQGLLRLLEPSATVHCRPKDESITKSASEAAEKQYTDISGRKCDVDVKTTLSDSECVLSAQQLSKDVINIAICRSAGGIKLVAGNNRITMDNTLDERLKLLEDRVNKAQHSVQSPYSFLTIFLDVA